MMGCGTSWLPRSAAQPPFVTNVVFALPHVPGDWSSRILSLFADWYAARNWAWMPSRAICGFARHVANAKRYVLEAST
jgi:hypothetical protein